MKEFSKIRIIIALAVGFLGSCILWLAQPLNNFLLNNSFIADNYLPELVVGMIVFLILLVNPLLMWRTQKMALNVRQLALIFAVLLVAAAPLQLLRTLPHTLARANMNAVQDASKNNIHKEMDLSPALYLDPDLTAAESPVSEQLVDQLYKGNAIPWSSWVLPTFSWGFMIFSCWLIMAGMVLILYPQWRENERLAFPLLTIQQTLIEKPADGSRVPPIFRSKIFWVTCIVVIILHSFNGLNYHTGGNFPKFPLSWSLWATFSEGIWRHTDWYLRSSSILFTIIGITFFMPNRVGFSLWFFFIAYQVYRMIGYEYMAPFNYNTSVDHRNGAIIGVAIIILWLGRKQWGRVFKAMFKKTHNDDVERRNRAAGWIFMIGILLFISWQLWAGVSFGWALVILGITFVTCLIIARIVAETGIPFIANYFGPNDVFKMVPLKWLDGASIYIGGYVDFLLSEGASRVSAIVMMIHGLGIDKKNKPRAQVRLVGLFLVVLIMGFLIAGAVHLWMGYNYPGSIDGKRVPIASWGSGRIGETEFILSNWTRGTDMSPNYNQPAHLTFGVILGAALQVGCLISPAWPLHPAGLLMANTWFLGRAWASIFLGWILKISIVAYGGAQAYRKIKPLFIGMIVGEVLAAIIWALVPVILIVCGMSPKDVGHIVIIPQ